MGAEILTTAGQTSVFQTALLSKTGGRRDNEDYCDSAQVGESRCWVVADGLGAHGGGGDASRAAVTALLDSFRKNSELSTSALESHVSAAQDLVLLMQQENPALSQMRTTLVTLITDSRDVLWAHVGDSRLYRFQARGLVAQTEDHSVPQSLVKAGEIPADQVRGHPDRNRLLRTLGEHGPARPCILPASLPLRDSDAFLLCTDGFWEYVLEMEMLADLSAAATPQEWLSRAESRLLRRVHGEYDNYSALAIFYAPRPALQDPRGRDDSPVDQEVI